jgi:glycosyltransferase involved in cell wall biosynthesis
MPPLIGYLVKTFPKLSETFILNEILELEKQGLNLHIFSLRQPAEGQVHPAVAQVTSPVTYLPTLLPKPAVAQETALMETQLKLFQRNASAYLRMVKFSLNCTEERRLHELLQGGYLAWKMQQLKVTHLHVHFANVPAATTEMAHAYTQIPYSMTAHAKDIYLTQAEVLNRRMAKAKFVLTCTDYNRHYLQGISTSQTPIRLAYHGLDLNCFQPHPAELNASGAQVPMILSVGRFCEKKGFCYLLEACHVLKQARLPFHCVIVGYGPLEAAIRQQIHDQQLEEQVTLTGQLTQDQLIDYYQQADIFALPCLVTDEGDRDGIPNVLLEAMAMALPLISTDISGISELVNSEKNGILVPEKAAVSLAKALERLIRQPSLRADLGRAARRTVEERFGLTRNVGEVKDWLLRAASDHSAQNLPQSQAKVFKELLTMTTS